VKNYELELIIKHFKCLAITKCINRLNPFKVDNKHTCPSNFTCSHFSFALFFNNVLGENIYYIND